MKNLIKNHLEKVKKCNGDGDDWLVVYIIFHVVMQLILFGLDYYMISVIKIPLGIEWITTLIITHIFSFFFICGLSTTEYY